MEHKPRTPEAPKSKEEILARLAEIDREVSGLFDVLPRISGEFQESHQGDDDAPEAQATGQRSDQISEQRGHLKAEAAALREQLAELEKAA